MGEDKEKEILAEETANINEEQETKEKAKKKKKEKPEDKIAEIEEKLEEFKDKYFRTLADMENYKKRMNADLARERKYAGFSLANKLIDSIVIFNQALNMDLK
jgi:molecular chaperone GrpE